MNHEAHEGDRIDGVAVSKIALIDPTRTRGASSNKTRLLLK